MFCACFWQASEYSTKDELLDRTAASIDEMRVLSFLSIGLVTTALGVAAFDAFQTDAGGMALNSTRISDVTSFWRSAIPDFAGSGAREFFSHQPDSRALSYVLGLPLWLVLGFLGILFGLSFRFRRSQGLAGSPIFPTRLSNFIYVIGVGFLMASVAGVIYGQFAKSLQADTAFLTVGQVWQLFNPVSIEQARGYAVGAWQPVFDTTLSLPALLICGLLGLGFIRAGSGKAVRAGEVSEVAPATVGPSMVTSPADDAQGSELGRALTSCRSAFLSVGLLSGMTNMLMMTGALFMLQIYDRILPSRSVPTLVALAIIVGVLFAALAVLDLIRNRILVRIAASLDEALSGRVYETIVRLPLKSESRGDGLQPLRDLDTVRGFISGPGPTALFDLPWMPLYLGIIFAFHTILGLTAVAGALILVAITLLTEFLSRRSIKAATGFAQTRNVLAEASQRNAEVVAAMGMAGRLGRRWADANQKYLALNQNVSDVTGGFGSITRALRMMLQSAVLGVGAYLVINDAATAGIIIAASILVARALAPVDLAITNWKGFIAARQSWERLNCVLDALPALDAPMALPAPRSNLTVEQATAVPPGTKKIVVQDVSFSLKSGQGLGIIGPSASGKSSLVRMIVGAWTPARGRIQLDGAALDQWPPESRGAHIGYLPQDVELFSGTVAENIARFEPNADPEAIIAAAEAAGVHELIVALAEGYETEIGEQGQVLSAGQRQRIGLARALYRDPFLVVLDEPNSNLDAEGEAALTGALASVRQRGGIVIVVAHRPSALSVIDVVLVMAKGRAVNFGPKEEVLSKVLRPKAVPKEVRVNV